MQTFAISPLVQVNTKHFLLLLVVQWVENTRNNDNHSASLTQEEAQNISDIDEDNLIDAND